MVNLQTPHPALLMGPETLDDAGVYQISDDLAIVQTVDYFTPIVDSPYAFGQIAAANALSDVYAMGATPITVLNIVGYPVSKLPREWLASILQGGADKVREAGAVILGGHSIDDVDPKFGLAVTGVVHPGKIWTNGGAQPGDVLVLTKPIGSGVVTTAVKRGLASDDDIREATAVMSALNKTAAETARAYPIHACTDITGFGLLGHAWEMASASSVSLRLFADKVPLLTGARKFASQNVIPGGSKRNAEHVAPHVRFDDAVAPEMRVLLADSVTSGGLLLAIESGVAPELVQRLHESGVTAAAVVGEVLQGESEIHVI